MSKIDTIAATGTAETVTAPLADLYLHPLNPRQDAGPEDVALLAQSLLACGLIQNLSGIRDEAGRIGIVAGGRRLRALALAAADNPALSQVPVRLAPDLATAEAWASAENTAREALAPAQEIRAYGKMSAGGASVTAIARAFAVTEPHVYRRLALANLPAPVLDALAAGEISLGQAAAFTVASDEALALEVLATVRGRDHSASWITARLQPLAIRSTDRRARFVGIEAYEAAGGKLTRDLFSEAIYLESPELLDRLFAEKLEAAAEAVTRAEGWKWAETSPETYLPWNYADERGLARIYGEEADLSEEEAEEYEELADLSNGEALDEDGEARLAELEAKIEPRFTEARKALAGCVLLVTNAGELTRTEGLVKPEDAAAAIEAGFLAPNRHGGAGIGSAGGSTKDAAPKSPYSQALVADMKALRLAAVQGALLAKPELVLDLLAFALSPASGIASSMLDIRAGEPTIEPTQLEGCEIDPRLTGRAAGREDDEEAPEWNADLAAAFLSFQERGKKHRNAVLTAALARTLPYGCHIGGRQSGLFDHIEDEAKADLRSVWTPNGANFFGRVSGGYLDALFAELLSAEPGDERVKAFGRGKKAEKVAIMERLFSNPQTRALYQVTAEQAERIARWQPDCF